MNELCHHGIKGMKWGIRRYQNADGSLTDRGKKHYYKKDGVRLNKNGKKLRKTVLSKVEENSDILDRYYKKTNETRSTFTNSHLKRLVDDRDKKYSIYKKAKHDYELTLSKKDKLKYEKALEEYIDSHLLIDAVNKYNNDKLYEDFLDEVSTKTLSDLGSEYSMKGKFFIKDLIGEYYKRDLD